MGALPLVVGLKDSDRLVSVLLREAGGGIDVDDSRETGASPVGDISVIEGHVASDCRMPREPRPDLIALLRGRGVLLRFDSRRGTYDGSPGDAELAEERPKAGQGAGVEAIL